MGHPFRAIAAITLMLMATGAIADDDSAEMFSRSIVAIHSTTNVYNYAEPWAPPRAIEGGGTGFAIAGGFILTNHHVAGGAILVDVKLPGEPEEVEAEVVYADRDCDLSLIRIVDEAARAALQPLELSREELIRPQASVYAIGFPVGGSEPSITGGVVSRVVTRAYSFAGPRLPQIQIDAAINPGNSGGPIVDSAGHVVGVVFQKSTTQENTGFAVPMAVIHHFLQDFELDRSGLGSPGFVALGLDIQPLAGCPALRRQVQAETCPGRGVVISGIHEASPLHKQLREGDVLIQIGGVPIDSDGRIATERYGKVWLEYGLVNSHIGDTLRLNILRRGEPMEVEVELSETARDYLMIAPAFSYQTPRYLVVGSLVLVPLTLPFLNHRWGKSWATTAPISLTAQALTEHRKDKTREVVVLTELKRDSHTHGYDNHVGRAVVSINGEPIRNLAHLAAIVSHARPEKTPFLNFELTGGRTVVLDTADLIARQREILQRFQIPMGMRLEVDLPIRAAAFSPAVFASGTGPIIPPPMDA